MLFLDLNKLKWDNPLPILGNSGDNFFLVTFIWVVWHLLQCVWFIFSKGKKGKRKEGKKKEKNGRERKKTLISHVWYKFSLSFQIPPLLGGKESEILLRNLSF